MSLPYDYARCGGNYGDDSSWLRAECVECLRRTSPGRPEWQSYIAPHAGPGRADLTADQCASAIRARIAGRK